MACPVGRSTATMPDDALAATGFSGDLDSVFGRAQVVGGAAMLAGSVLGVIAQLTNLGVPYLVRALTLGVTAERAVLRPDHQSMRTQFSSPTTQARWPG